MPDSNGAFIWYELMTPDPERARTFYQHVVQGWAIGASGETLPNQTEYRMIKRSDGKEEGGVLRLTEEMKAQGARPVWLGYIAVDDVDAAVGRVVADGGAVTMPAFDLPGIGRIAMVADPWGAPLYLMTPTPPPGDPDGVSDSFDTDKPQHVRWNELWASNPAGAVDFYKRHFGWGQEGDMDMGAMGKYLFIQRDGVMIGAIMPRMPDVPVSMWNYYIGVDDIDRAAEATKAGGGRVVNGPMEIPGGEYAVNAVDPQGALFGLVGPRMN